MPRLCKLRLASGLRNADSNYRGGGRPGTDCTVLPNGQFEVVEPLTRQRFAQHLQTTSTDAHVPPLSPPFPAEELEAHGSPHCKLANASYKHPSPFKNSASRKPLISLSTFLIGFGQHSIRIILSLQRSTTVLGHPSIILQKTRCLASGLAACCSHSQRSGKDVSVFQLSVRSFFQPAFPLKLSYSIDDSSTKRRLSHSHPPIPRSNYPPCASASPTLQPHSHPHSHPHSTTNADIQDILLYYCWLHISISSRTCGSVTSHDSRRPPRQSTGTINR